MTITYKINNVAKDLNIPVKQVIEIVAQMGGEPKKTGGSLNEADGLTRPQYCGQGPMEFQCRYEYSASTADTVSALQRYRLPS